MAEKILITGASSGIGSALAQALACRGHALALTARRLDRLADLQRDIQAHRPSVNVAVAALDVTNYGAVPAVLGRLADALGGLDVVVANAGIGLGEKIGSGRFDLARRTIETNLLGAMATVDAAVEYFLRQGHGHIVGNCSIMAFRGTPRNSSYSASKAGLASYLETLRAELRGKNITVTVLYPGYIDTPLNDMLAHRPFVISAEKGASLIARIIERRARSAVIPFMPWWPIIQLMKVLPASLLARRFF